MQNVVLDLPLALLFRCASCDEPAPTRSSFPLCDSCSESLRDCPPLCSSCASPLCIAQGTCLRPWASHAAIRTYHARYLLIGAGYRTLRRWKTRSGPLFTRRILKSGDEKLHALAALRADAIVPIPQRVRRSFELGGSPAGLIAGWLARELRLPVRSLLQIEHKPRAQAELSLLERMGSRMRFTVPLAQARGPTVLPLRVILVDDFMTTGRTLESAAQALGEAGVREVHAFCLGLRPLFRAQARAAASTYSR